MTRTWQVLVPVKALSSAKSRLDVPPALRGDLVLAMLRDVLAAMDACPEVLRPVVVTQDPAVATATHADSCTVNDPRDLNDELKRAADRVRERDPQAGTAVVMADLPSLRATDLTGILRSAPLRTGAFVRDASGAGTTMLLAPYGVLLAPSFGRRSADAHAARGLELFGGAGWPSARQDVDTLADLRAAEALGLGRHTAGVLEAESIWQAARDVG